MNERMKTNLEEIHDLLKNTADTSKLSVYTILRGLKGGELFSDSMYEHLLKAVELDMLRVWKSVNVNPSFKYERTTTFVEARILEYFRNEEHLTADEAEEVLEYIRELASSLTMQTLQNKTKPNFFYGGFNNNEFHAEDFCTEDSDAEDSSAEDSSTEDSYTGGSRMRKPHVRRPYPGYSHTRRPRARHIRRRRIHQHTWIPVTVLAVTVSGLAVTAAYLKGKADGKNSH